MRNVILAAFAALSLLAGLAPVAQARWGEPQTYHHSGPYDDTGHGPGQTGMEGGGG